MTSSTKAMPAPYPIRQSPPEVPGALLAALRGHLTARRVSEGIRLFRRHADLLKSLRPEQPNAGALVGALAEWVDIGFDRFETLKRVLQRFPRESRARLPLCDYMHLRLADGMQCMREEMASEAIAHFDFVIDLAGELEDKETLAIANFWKGRCLRQKGDYDAALVYGARGRELAAELGHDAMAAVMAVMESWLVFQKGRATDAIAILQKAQATLAETDDYVTLGNIHSSYGRLARRNGQYEQAMEHFNRAIVEYRKRDAKHRNLARSLANIALVERAIAVQLKNKIDAIARRRRRTEGGAGGTGTISRYRQRMEQLRQSAFVHLDEAAKIYADHPSHHGAGSVHLNRGYLHLDNGDFDSAESEAREALALAAEKEDYILMARAHLLCCMVGNARVEEEVSEGSDAGKHARDALDAAHEGVELAKHTQNRRLLATAHVWQGLSYCNSFFEDCDAARQCYDQAVALLKGQPGHLSEELHALKSRIVRSGSVDATLRAWSQGALGEKTFQQITEEFAELIIPKIWEREGRKVSRVASRLSISPKKVRRILAAAGRRSARP